MRLSSVVFPAPRKPVKIVMGTVVPLSSMISMGEGFLSNRRPPGKEPGSSRTRPRRAPPRRARWDIGTTPLFYEFTQIDSRRLRYIEEIDLLRVRKLREWLAVHVRRIVLMRINLEIARQPGLWDDALARRDRQRVAEEDGGIRQGL